MTEIGSCRSSHCFNKGSQLGCVSLKVATPQWPQCNCISGIQTGHHRPTLYRTVLLAIG
jgi:hypothetical protein